MESKQLLEAYAKGERVFINADLRGADLYNANLRGADLCDADLRGADLRGADLYNANLRGAHLCGANLYNANLRGADLCGADLRGADLCDANLIYLGTCSRGYSCYVSKEKDEKIIFRGGCHVFTLGEAREYWGESYQKERVHGDEWLRKIDYAEAEAKARGWIKEDKDGK